MQLTALVNASYKAGDTDSDGFQAGQLKTSMFQQVNKDTSIACELAYGRGDNKETKFVDVAGDLAFSATLGSKYALSDSASLSTKMTLKGDSTTVDGAWTQNLGGNSSLTLAQRYKDSAPAFSVAYTL